MDDTTAFDHQLSGEIVGLMGPVRPVDDLAVFESVTAASRTRRWRFAMYSALKFAAAAAIVALFGGLLLSGILNTSQSDEAFPAAVTDSPAPSTTEESAFPTGSFVADEAGLTLELRGDGTCERAGVPCTYGVRGDLYTEMTFEDPSGEQVPATYRWDFDGEQLAFRLWGEDRRPGRRDAYTDHAFRAVGETLPLPDNGAGFPTGTFVSADRPDHGLEFGEDGGGRAFISDKWSVPFTYGVNGSLYSEMAFQMLSGDPTVPVTYYWDWDGEQLTFELWGEDLSSSRSATYGQNTWIPVEDPRVVVIAVSDIEAGDQVFRRMTQLGVVPAGEVGADVLTDRDEVASSVAAQPISKGQPITPNMLEPLPTE